MSKLLIVLFIYYLQPLVAFGQQGAVGGLVKYSITPVESKVFDLEIQQNPRIGMVLEQLTVSLEFTDNQSVFTLDNNLDISEKDLKDAKLFTKVSSGDYYWQDLYAAYHAIKSTPFMKGDYLLVDSFENGWHTKWKITGDSKEISGYKCFKATRDDLSLDLDRNNRKYSVVAWFCPELPFPFGPIKYGGLPGLILELQTYTAVYGAKYIVIEREDVTIPSLPDIELRTEETYYKDMFETIRERRKRRETH